jgi:hypothetical protein
MDEVGTTAASFESRDLTLLASLVLPSRGAAKQRRVVAAKDIKL